MGAKIPQETYDKLDRLVGQHGWSISRAAKECGIGRTSASQYIQAQKLSGRDYDKRRDENGLLDPLAYHELGDEARRAVDDFGFFRSYYLGRESKPWQTQAGHKMVELLETQDDEYAVLNCPPGSGKSTAFASDAVLWLIVRDRSVRIQLGSKTTRQAKDYSAAVRRALERTYVVDGAEGCIAQDFGRFKPDNADLWRADEFIVEQLDNKSIEVKEPTVRAISQEMGFLGARADFVVWDDLVDNSNTRNPEMRNKLEEFWRTTAETRLEPGGLLLLVGQRIGPEDLYHHCLQMRVGDDDFDWEGATDDEIEALDRKYHHIIFPAHNDAICQQEHGSYKTEDGKKLRIDPPAWPDGCLLDPKRLPWRKLSTLKYNDRRTFEIGYQQQDVSTGQFLVAEEWLTGGTDAETGEVYPGCYDRAWQGQSVPSFPGGYISAISVDPSPTKYWSVQHWVFSKDLDCHYLVDHVRMKMHAPMFLDRLRDGSYVGLAEDWVKRAKDMGKPITHLIFERNAAQRFVLQTQSFQDWLRKSGVTLVPHQTGNNKNDAEFGVQSIGSMFKQGKVVLPYGAPWGRKITDPLVNELLRWPEASTDDAVMAAWFWFLNVRNLTFADKPRIKAKRPSWLGGGQRFLSSKAG